MLDVAAGHLATAKACDPLPSLIGLAISAVRQGRSAEAESLCGRCDALIAVEAGRLSRRDVFIVSALAGLLAADGDGLEDVGQLAADIADEAIDAADGARYTLAFEPPPGRNGAA
jgi:hypothetical protein